MSVNVFLRTGMGFGSGLRGLASDLAAGSAALWRTWRNRREVHRLSELDDRTLKDIGLLRSDSRAPCSSRSTRIRHEPCRFDGRSIGNISARMW
jgi:uncharacterized protein YjiS (DUF1127 family)